MCLLVVLYRVLDDAPILIAANREERFDRPTLPPRVYRGPPRYVCGLDLQANGTWLGVNEHRLVVAVTNRARPGLTASPRSRGLLCRDLLACKTARKATAMARTKLSNGSYAGANFVCLDPGYAAAVYGGRDISVAEITPGLHLLTDGDLDDPEDRRQSQARRLLEASGSTATISVKGFLETTAVVCAHKGIVIRTADSGTVSADQIAVTTDGGHAVYRHTPGPPDRLEFDDFSTLLARVLGGSNPGGTPEVRS